MQLVAKLARVRIADDVYQSGDNTLTSAISVNLGEDDRSSSCSFAVYDPGFAIGAKYRKISVTAGGILVPSDLLNAPSPPATGAAPAAGDAAAAAGSATLGAPPTGEVPLAIVRECLRQGVSDPVKIAFILAVAEGESSFNYRAYNPETTNPNVPDKRYGGRGLVQITQRYNYEYFGRILNIPLAENPDLAFRPDVGLYLLVAGIKRGWCSRGGLDRWVTGAGSIAAAYRAIQGGVWGARYQRFFDRWLRDVPALIAQAGGSAAPAPPATPPADPMSAPPAAAPPAAPVAAPAAESSAKGTEIIVELAVGWGLTFRDCVAFHFIHTGTESSWDASGAQITTFSGKSIRWLLTRVPVTESFENMTFRQYLESRCRAFNLDLEMEGDGLRYQHLSQDGQTHLNLILREARRIGFSIREGTGDRSGTLIVTPTARPQFTNFIIDEEVLIKPSKFTDEARGSTPSQPLATVSSPGTGAQQTAATIDRASGTVQPAGAPPSQAGTGNAAAAQTATPGAATAPVGGTVQPIASATSAATPSPAPAPTANPATETKTDDPVRTTRPDGAIVTTARETVTKTEPNKITRTVTTRTTIAPPNGAPTLETRVEVTEITPQGRKITVTITQGTGTPQVSPPRTEPLTAEDRRLLEVSARSTSQQSAAAPTPAPAAGLPNQAAGAIDLIDGRAEAAALGQEAQRVKGYPSSHTLVMNMDTLILAPGQIVGLSKRLFPDEFAVEQRLGTVTHDWAAGTVAITCYTPQAPPPGAPPVSGSPTQLASPATPTPGVPGKLQNPMPQALRGTPFDMAGRIRGRPHCGIDQAGGSSDDILAAEAGRVTWVANRGGYGQTILIEHTGEWQGWETLYAHLSAYRVSVGAMVVRGQLIGIEGNTGASRGNHLHFETKRGGQRVDPEPYLSPCPAGVYGQGRGTPLKCR